MKGVVGFLFFMLFLAGFAFVLLQGRQMAESNIGAGGAAVAEIAGIDWRPAVVGADTMAEDSGMFVRFSADGSINGDAGCNTFFGSLQKTDTGVSIGALGATRRACPAAVMERETAFLEALQNTKSIQAGRERLRLLADGNVLLAELVAMPGA